MGARRAFRRGGYPAGGGWLPGKTCSDAAVPRRARRSQPLLLSKNEAEQTVVFLISKAFQVFDIERIMKLRKQLFS